MTTIKLKNGSGAPTAGDLAQGEPALDLTNKRLYTEDSLGAVIEVGTNPGVNVTFADNRKAIFGASSDLQIYHDGTGSYIQDTGQGYLYIGASNQLRLTNSDASEEYIRATVNGAVDIKYDNATKLATTSTGIDVTGVITTDGMTTSADINFGDNDKAIFGAGSDLQIYHDGSNSYIAEGGTGNLQIQGQNLSLEDSTGTRFFLGIQGGETRLYNQGNEKVAVTSTGIDVTGTVTADGLTVDGDVVVNDTIPQLQLMESDTTDVNSVIKTTAGQFRIQTINDAANSTTNRFIIDHSTGDISFYEDTGTTAKLFWDASAESLGIGQGVFSGTQALNLKGEGIAIKNDKSGSNNNWSLIRNTATASESNISFVSGAGEAMVIDHGGNVGIGTSSPAQMLELSANNGLSGVANVLRFNDSDVGVTAAQPTGRIEFAENDGGNTTVSAFLEVETVSTSGGGEMTFGTGAAGVTATERMRITSSGNLLVGKTSADDFSSAGAQIEAGGQFTNSVASAPSLRLNRGGSDGDIIELNKAGATVGSIGTELDRLFIGSDDSMIFFDAGSTNAIWPWTSTATSSGDADNTIDIGDSDNRFKDLYLSGGVYLGGTGSANKLDDYEEGTWTPTVAGQTSAGSYTVTDDGCTYTKIGRQVTLIGKLRDITEVSAGSGNLNIGGFPFSVSEAGQGSLRFNSLDVASNSVNFIIENLGTGSFAFISESKDNATAGVTAISAISSGTTDIFFTLTYFV